MKRFAAIAVLGLALTACGSSGHVQPIGSRPLTLVPPSPISLRFSTSSNRAFARRDVQKLIRNVVLPRSARRVKKVPTSAPSWFRHELSQSDSGTAFAHRTWVVDAPLVDVARYFRSYTHPRPRPMASVTYSTTLISPGLRNDWQFPPVPGRALTRWLDVDMLRLPSGATVVTAQAGDEWIQPPPTRAELPGTVRRIDITSRYDRERPGVRLHVRDRYDVASVVSWMNGLGVSPRVFCFGGGFGEPTVTLTFHSASGAVVARGTLGQLSDSCGSLSLVVKGRKAPPLHPGDLLARIQELLHADLTPPRPRDVSRCLRARGWNVRRTGDDLVVRKDGRRSTLTFLATGKVTTTGAQDPAISRCIRSSPVFVAYK